MTVDMRFFSLVGDVFESSPIQYGDFFQQPLPTPPLFTTGKLMKQTNIGKAVATIENL